MKFSNQIISLNKKQKKYFKKTEGFRVRDAKGAEGGANWNERRFDFCILDDIFLSEVR
jgi:hypothetical protein